MKPYSGFPRQTDFFSLPVPFLSGLLPEIDDIIELKATLFAISAIYGKKGSPKFTTCDELLTDSALIECLPEPVRDTLTAAMKSAAERGTFLRVEVERGDQPVDIYLLNTRANQDIVVRITSGELDLSGLTTAFTQPQVKKTPQPDIFALYEQNIGLLTPMVADQLRDAEKAYPSDWLREAFKEAVNQNKRKWSYIAAILERWASEGKTHGAYQRNSKAGASGRIRTGYRRSSQS